MEKVSVNIPVYNREPYVGECLESVLSLDYENLEIVVFNDGSTDGSRDIVEKYKKNDKRLKFIDSRENTGLPNALNQLLKASTGTYVLTVGADDVILNGWLSDAVDRLDHTNAKIAGSYGTLRIVDSRLKDTGAVQGGAFSRFVLPFFNPHCHGGSLLKREALVKTNGYLETCFGKKSVAVDLFLWYRLFQNFDLQFDHETRYLYRTHDDQMGQVNDQAKYLRTKTYIHDHIIAENQELYDRILSGDLHVNGENLRRICLLLAIIIKRMSPSSENYLSNSLAILDVAKQLQPNDYGVDLRKVEVFEAVGLFKEALDLCDHCLGLYSDDSYICRLFTMIKERCFKRSGGA